MAKFEAPKCQESADFKPIPDGWYEAVAEEVSIENTKAGTGTYLQIKFSITDPQFTNRKMFDRFNLTNPNQQAAEIGWQQLSDCARAMGFQGIIGETLPDDTEWYLNRTCQIKIIKDKKDDQGRSKVCAYKKSDNPVQSVAELTNSKPEFTEAPAGPKPFWK